MKKIVLCGVLAGLAVAAGLLLISKSSTPLSKYERLTLAWADKEPKPEHPGEAAAYWAELLRTPNGENPFLLNLEAIQTIRANRGGSAAPNLFIEEIGPGNFGGRIRGVVVHPNDPDSILIGGIDGGVWKTEDGGKNWRPTNDFLATLAIGSMIVDPDNADTVYAGTGEGFFNVDAAQGLGIYKSTDFGETWTLVDGTANANFNYVNRLARVPGSTTLIAATRAGLFRTTNETNWFEVSGVTTASRGFVDLKVDPTDATRLYASHFGNSNPTSFIMRSANSGQTWTQLGAAQGVPTTDVGRMEIGIGSDGVIYLAVGNRGNTTRGLWRSPVGGGAFVKTASNANFIPRQGWYDLMIGVDPVDSNRVYMGAVDVYRTTDAGATINQIAFWNPAAGAMDQYVHADIHGIAFDPTDPMTVFITCDGGIFKTSDGGNNFEPLNNNLRLTQYYGFDIHPDGSRVIGGTQDNGSHLYYGDKVHWWQWFGGDGGYCAWDQQMPGFIYGSLPNGGLFGSSDQGVNAAQITLPNTTGALFIEPLTIAPSDGNKLIVGTDNVYYSGNIRNLTAATWSDDSGPLGGSVSATTISQHNSLFAYAGTTQGTVFKTTNLGSGAAWTNITPMAAPNNSVTWVEVDPHDPTDNTLYVTYSGYGADRIFKSTNGGTSWTSIHGNLPNIPLFCVVGDNNDPGRLWLGSELGLFTTGDNTRGGIEWVNYDYGIGFTRVIQLRKTGADTLWFATHGRGIYKATFEPAEISMGVLDDSGCDDDGVLDLEETVQVPVTVANRGGYDLVGATVTLTADTVDITVSTGPQNYGTIAPGDSMTLNFEVTLDALSACLDTAVLTVDLTFAEGSDSQDFEILLGADPDIQTGTYSEDAEGATLLSHEAFFDVDDWATVTTQAHSGARSWFTSNAAVTSDKVLSSPWLEVQNASAELSFWLYYDMELSTNQPFDGAVLEVRKRGDRWRHVTTSLPYDGRFFTNNTLATYHCWSGLQTTWRQGVLSLADYDGEEIQFRFRVTSDSNTAQVGFWVDDIAVTNVQWLSGNTCDTSACCFLTLGDALTSIYTSLGNGEWPGVKTIQDYVADLENVCSP